LNQPGIEPEFR